MTAESLERDQLIRENERLRSAIQYTHDVLMGPSRNGEHYLATGEWLRIERTAARTAKRILRDAGATD